MKIIYLIAFTVFVSWILFDAKPDPCTIELGRAVDQQLQPIAGTQQGLEDIAQFINEHSTDPRIASYRCWLSFYQARLDKELRIDALRNALPPLKDSKDAPTTPR